MAKVTTRLVTAPLRASTRDWVVAGALAGAVALTAALDKDVRGEAVSWDRPWINTVDDVGHTFQKTPLFFATAGAFYVGGYAADQPKIRRTGRELVVAFVVAQAGTQLMKSVAGRARPDQNEGSGKFIGPTLKDSHSSLWSGDVTTAFTLASVLSAEVRHPAVTVLLYGLAASTAFQRVHTERHWLSDVAAAAVWSTAVGIGTVKIENRKLKIEKQSGKSVSFRLMPMGVAVEW
jgi:membrane-associated phospholipid phosphatase